MNAKKFIVSGKVQGVYFRKFSQAEALALGLEGWVRNRREGTVEVFAQGPEENLKSFEKRLKLGPPFSEVHSLIAKEVPAEKIHHFTILDTV